MVLRFRGIPLNQTPLSHVPQSGMIHILSPESTANTTLYCAPRYLKMNECL